MTTTTTTTMKQEEEQQEQQHTEQNTEQQKEQHAEHLHYMTLALQVAKAALSVGEVPVGCVIVYHSPQGPTVVSHGANQVNATRDATRHAEIVALDRMLTGSASSDQLRLPPDLILQSAHGGIPDDSPLCTEEGRRRLVQDKWVNEPDTPDHWKNAYGWGSGQALFQMQDLAKCDLYVTCEPCIMCAAALARVHIGRVFFGCRNDRFGGCGSLMHLHQPDALPSSSTHTGYPIYSGILEQEAIALLRSFYDRENFHAPDEKRKRKDGVC